MSKELEAIPKTTEGLRDALFDEINLIREGKSNPQRAREIARMADKIIDSIKVQIQYGRLLNKADSTGKATYLGTIKSRNG